MNDLKYALRGLLRTPGFTAVAILSLALGIGANVTIYTIANAFLSRPVPGVTAPDRLVRIYRGGHSALQYRELARVRDENAVFDGVIGEHIVPVGIANGEGTDRVPAAVVTPGYFATLGVRPAAGRLFGADSTEQSIVLSYALWQRQFGGDPRIVGTTVRVNDRPLVVAGVAPARFASSQSLWRAALWLSPGATQAVIGSQLENWGGSLYTTARLRDGQTIENANAVVGTLARRMISEDTTLGRQFTLRADDANGVTAELRQPATVVSGFLAFVVGLVLLIACANVANLLLARAAGRQREMGVRIALGARRTQLVRQLLIESGLLTVAASVAGFAVAAWSANLIAGFMMARSPEPVLLSFAPDGRVAVITIGLAILTTILFGLVPALRATSVHVLPVLREAAPQTSSRSLMRSVLVGTQVALCTILLACSSLFLRSLIKARVIDPGFDTSGIVDASIDLGSRQLDSAQGSDFYRRLLERTRALPGVRSATVAALIPLGGSNMQTGVWTPERVSEERSSLQPYFNIVGEDYFATLGIALVAGREFRAGEADGVVVNEQMARHIAPDGQVSGALGRRVSASGREGPWLTVIGVARDTRYNAIGEKTPDFMYLPFAGNYRAEMVVHARGMPGGEPALRRALVSTVAEMDSRLPAVTGATLAEDMRIALLPAQLGAALLGAFGGLALLLATMGIYGVASYSVAQRTRELGIRAALGATANDVVRMVLGQSLRVAAIGTAIGLALALGVARLIASQLYGVGPTDPVTFLGMPALLVAVSLAATLLPALRATRVDPIVALRAE